MSAIFNFQSLLVVILLLICTCTYFRTMFPRIIDNHKTGFVFHLGTIGIPQLLGVFWKCARIGERLSPYVSICCIVMALYLVFWTA